MPDSRAPPAFYDDLDAALDEAWRRLARGAADRRSSLHTPMIATVAPDGAPEVRTVVLRGADPATGVLRCHTDARSAKVAAIGAEPRVQLAFYDPRAKIQIRASGLAAVHRTDDRAGEAWRATGLHSRRCYLADPAPGTPIDGPGSGLPDHLATAAPEETESEAGRANFAVVTVRVAALDWLYLAARGHRRARFERAAEEAGTGWKGQWLVP